MAVEDHSAWLPWRLLMRLRMSLSARLLTKAAAESDVRRLLTLPSVLVLWRLLMRQAAELLRMGTWLSLIPVRFPVTSVLLVLLVIFIVIVPVTSVLLVLLVIFIVIVAVMVRCRWASGCASSPSSAA